MMENKEMKQNISMELEDELLDVVTGGVDPSVIQEESINKVDQPQVGFTVSKLTPPVSGVSVGKVIGRSNSSVNGVFVGKVIDIDNLSESDPKSGAPALSATFSSL